MIRVFDEKDFSWDDVPRLIYKEDKQLFQGVTRQVLFDGEGDIPCQFRYFEVEAGGYSTLEHHEHFHFVMIGRGKGQVLLGTTVHEVKQGDTMVIPSFMFHQFRANRGEALGFFCLVNKNRDKVAVPTKEELEELRRHEAVRQFLDGE